MPLVQRHTACRWFQTKWENESATAAHGAVADSFSNLVWNQRQAVCRWIIIIHI